MKAANVWHLYLIDLLKINTFAVLELNDLMRINKSFIQSVRSLNCDEG